MKPDSPYLQSLSAIISYKANTKDKKTSIFAGMDCKSALSYTTDFFLYPSNREIGFIFGMICFAYSLLLVW
jgi:hypothetical protein